MEHKAESSPFDHAYGMWHVKTKRAQVDFCVISYASLRSRDVLVLVAALDWNVDNYCVGHSTRSFLVNVKTKSTSLMVYQQLVKLQILDSSERLFCLVGYGFNERGLSPGWIGIACPEPLHHPQSQMLREPSGWRLKQTERRRQVEQCSKNHEQNQTCP